MKKPLYLFLLLLCSYSRLYAQTLADSALRFNMPAMSYPQAVQAKVAQMQAANPGDTTEGGDIMEFTRKAHVMQQYFCTNAPADSDARRPAAEVLMSVVMEPDQYCTGGGGNWQCVGPFNNCYGGFENQGRANAVWVSPSDTNFILAATYGGLWKSRNGGLSWQCHQYRQSKHCDNQYAG